MGKDTMNKIDFQIILHAEAMTHPGLCRSTNQDALGFFPEDGCFFVADGMGGGSAGDIASSLLENELSEAIEISGNETHEELEKSIRNAIGAAHQKIRSYADARTFEQMGTTLALMLFDPWNPHSAKLCHVGDSRIYRFRDQSLKVLTRDHTVGAELEQDMPDRWKNNSMGDHRNSYYSHILTRVIGSKHDCEPEWTETDIRPQDRYLICSDGVTTMLSETEIQNAMSSMDQPEEVVRALSDSVLQAGAKDNFSIIIVFVREFEFESQNTKSE